MNELSCYFECKIIIGTLKTRWIHKIIIDCFKEDDLGVLNDWGFEYLKNI